MYNAVLIFLFLFVFWFYFILFYYSILASGEASSRKNRCNYFPGRETLAEGHLAPFPSLTRSRVYQRKYRKGCGIEQREVKK